MINIYDTANLRSAASFKTKLMKNVYWVPVRELGCPSLPTETLKSYTSASIKELKKVINNPYSLFQYIQACSYMVRNDISYKQISGITWEIHQPSEVVIANKGGCCSSISALFTELLKDRYEEVAAVCIISNIGVGHVINYIRQGHSYYFCDAFSHLPGNLHLIPCETGNRSDFCRSSYLVGGCIETNSISDFIEFFVRYSRIKKRDYAFFLFNGSVTPPVSIVRVSNNRIRFYITSKMSCLSGIPKSIEVLVKNEKNIIEFVK